ncbi:MAG: PA0069 family radical SAM protein [Sphingobacteriales bacterium]|nr:MAG: PA0069 family radical SAM protein [Sphingobacteriales bacterium]
MKENYQKGQGAQQNVKNRFEKHEYVLTDEDWDANKFATLEEMVPDRRTKFYIEHPKKIVNEVTSPDLGLAYSLNPYQGCEHGCIYCYARNSHQYWGFSAGIDFERNIMIKYNAPELLRKHFDNPKWKPYPFMLSGNTDCYQPIERKTKLTRQLLEICLEYKHPVSIITKNSLILRDIDIINQLAILKLVHVNISITSLDESLRQKLEPRTATAAQRMKVVEQLSASNIPVNIMVAPVIPALNDHEIPEIIKTAAEKGALSAAYTIVRLNGEIGQIFEDWIHKTFPDRANKVLRQIAACHGGKLNDSRWGTRMKGEGEWALTINKLFKMAKRKHMAGKIWPEYDLTIFKRPERGQLSLF